MKTCRSKVIRIAGGGGGGGELADDNLIKQVSFAMLKEK